MDAEGAEVAGCSCDSACMHIATGMSTVWEKNAVSTACDWFTPAF